VKFSLMITIPCPSSDLEASVKNKLAFLCLCSISFRWFLNIIGGMFSFLNFVNSRLISMLVFHGGKVYGWTLIIKLKFISCSLAHYVRSPMCLYAGLSEFLVILAAYIKLLSIFLSFGEVQKPGFGCFQLVLNKKLLRRVLCLCCRWCLLSSGGLV
jgi:hypothetical protein